MSAKKIILNIAGALVLGVIGFATLFYASEWLLESLFRGMSTMKDRVDIDSPDHRYVATGYHILGSAMDANMTIVVVHAKGQSYDDPKNDSVLVADNLSPFQLTWDGDQKLTVHCSLDQTYRKKDFWNDVSIEYIGK